MIPLSRARHLVLVGLPGAGKSTIGAAVARRLRRPFIDLDREIERSAGLSVAEIFATRGEPGFRELERRATEKLIRAEPAIIAPGGGWITVPESVAILRPTAHLLYLKVEPETALKRLGWGASRRPLLAGNPSGPEQALRELFERRRAAYEAADLVVETEHLTRQQVTNVILELARESLAY